MYKRSRSVLENLLEELKKNYDYDFIKIDKDKYKINITDDIRIEVTRSGDDLCFFSPITFSPKEKKEEIYTYLMKANLLGQGTGKSSIGMDKDDKFLTLSYLMTYEDNYINFKEKLEDFINYLSFWEEEIRKMEHMQTIL